MKKQLLTLLALTCATLAHAQSPANKPSQEKLQSNAEAFSEKSGSLLQKQFEDVGSIKSCKIQVATFTDLINGQKTLAVRLEKPYSNSVSSDSKIALLDPDEIDALLKSLKIMQEKVFVTNPAQGTYTEVNYTSRGGFKAGCYYDKKAWTTFMKLEKYDGNSYVWFESADTQKLIDLILLAKDKLK